MGAEPETEPVKTPKNGSRELRSRAFLEEARLGKKIIGSRKTIFRGSRLKKILDPQHCNCHSYSTHYSLTLSKVTKFQKDVHWEELLIHNAQKGSLANI